MMIKRQDNYNSIFIKSFKSSGEVEVGNSNRLKYHYASANVFYSILKDENVYFADIRYMNDKKKIDI